MLIIFLSCFVTGFGQEKSKLERYSWLLGEWQNDSKEKTNQAMVKFSFTYDLARKIIIRRSSSQYPEIGKKVDFLHEDLMIIYPDQAGKPDKAVYFDNEGHIINYKISFSGRSVIFNNYDRGNNPAYRITYTQTDDGNIRWMTEMSRDSENYIPLEEGNAVRTKVH